VGTIYRTRVGIEDLAEFMRRLTAVPTPPDVLERRRQLLGEAEKVRAAMDPIPGDIKDLIREERGEELLG
jgi:hypothetical protein